MHQIKPLLRKNYLQWKRNKVGALFEFLTPILFCLLLLLFNTNKNSVDVSEQSYLNKSYSYLSNLTKQLVNENETEEKLILKSCNSSQFIAFAGNYGIIFQQLQNTLQSSGYTKFQNFTDEQELDNHIKSYEYELNEQKICFGVAIYEENYYLHQFSYSLKFNLTRQLGDIPSTLKDRFNKLKQEEIEEYDKYINSGFITLQHLIDNIILNYSGWLNTNIVLAPQKVFSHQKEVQGINFDSIRLVIILPIFISILRMIYGIVLEKEKRIRMSLKMMGMTNSSFYLSWIIQYFIMYFLLSIIISCILKYSILSLCNWEIIFIWLLLFYLSIIAFGYTMQAFCIKPRNAILLSAFMLFACIGFIDVKSHNSPENVLIAISTQPLGAAELTGIVMGELEQQKIGLSWSNIATKYGGYSVLEGFLFLFFETIYLFLIGTYFNNVISNEMKQKKSYFFCLKCLRRNNQSSGFDQLEDLEEQNLNQGSQDNQEEVNQILKDLEQKKEFIKLEKVTKIYEGGKRAVVDLSLNIYQGQIFGLVGHNGAGKTTLLNIMTGADDVTQGSVKIFDIDLQNNNKFIRKIMGVCPQDLICFDNLTVIEHLQLFAKFKQIPEEKMQGTINSILQELDLLELRDIQGKNLQASDKRKMQIAIAFLGDSRLIYLDEPTTSMDTQAKRQVWEMIRKHKDGKIIILTTNSMEEVDLLSDRIAIIDEGRLVCLGSSMFLKNKYGVGYNLRILLKKEQDNNQTELKTQDNGSQTVIQFITNLLPDSQVLSIVASELIIQLPFKLANKFSSVFEKLDENKNNLFIHSYSISITTLNEVFLKIASQGVNEEGRIAKQLSEEIIEEGKQPQDEELQLPKPNEIEKEKDEAQINKIQFFSLLKKRFNSFKRDRQAICCEFIAPIYLIFSALQIVNYVVLSPYKNLELMPSKLYSDLPVPLMYGMRLQEQQNIAQQLLSDFTNQNITLQYLSSDNIVDFYNKSIIDKTSNITEIGSVFMDQYTKDLIKLYLFSNTMYIDSAPLLVNLIHQSFLKQRFNNSMVYLKTSVNPLPLTFFSQKNEDAFNNFSLVYQLVLALSLIPASIIGFIMKEKVSNMKSIQILSGVSPKQYWGSNFLFDLLKYFITSFFVILFIVSQSTKFLIDKDDKITVCFLIIVYGFSLIPSTYIASFYFKTPGKAQMAVFFLNYLSGYFGSVLIFVFKIFDTTRTFGNILQWILRLIPQFSFALALSNINLKQFYALFEYQKQDSSPAYSLEVAGPDFIFLCLEAAILISIMRYLEKKNIAKQTVKIQNLNNKYEASIEDQDIIKEKEQIFNSDISNYTVRVNDLVCKYNENIDKNKNKVALKKTSFGIKKGEILALLGLNKQGKSTIINLLAGQINKSYGQIHIDGKPFDSFPIEDLNISYCPQNNDCFFENMTVKEHLQLFIEIKAIKKNFQAIILEKLMNEIDLKKYENIKAGKLSSGNKRKLQIAISLIGNPAVLLLDEPTTNLDPQARRSVWKIINKIAFKQKNSAVLFATHSMEEAESIATRIGIIVDGEIKCLGSIQYLSSRFGQNYEIEFKYPIPSKQQLIDKIQILNSNIDELSQIIINQGEDILSQLSQMKVDQKQIKQIFESLKVSNEIVNNISLFGFGSHLYYQLKKNKQINLLNLIQYIIQEEVGLQIYLEFQKKYGQIDILEHFDNYYRIKITEQNQSISKLFQFLEEIKQKKILSQYTLKQATLDQIFSLIADKKIGVDAEQIRRKKQSSIIELSNFDKLLDNNDNQEEEDDAVNKKNNENRVLIEMSMLSGEDENNQK